VEKEREERHTACDVQHIIQFQCVMWGFRNENATLSTVQINHSQISLSWRKLEETCDGVANFQLFCHKLDWGKTAHNWWFKVQTLIAYETKFKN
jgi:hypothetical protein